jgi:hypothetical protein
MENIFDVSLLFRRTASEYLSAMADFERRAYRGELTVRQVRHEVFALGERFGVEVALVMQ